MQSVYVRCLKCDILAIKLTFDLGEAMGRAENHCSYGNRDGCTIFRI